MCRYNIKFQKDVILAKGHEQMRNHGRLMTDLLAKRNLCSLYSTLLALFQSKWFEPGYTNISIIFIPQQGIGIMPISHGCVVVRGQLFTRCWHPLALTYGTLHRNVRVTTGISMLLNMVVLKAILHAKRGLPTLNFSGYGTCSSLKTIAIPLQ